MAEQPVDAKYDLQYEAERCVAEYEAARLEQLVEQADAYFEGLEAERLDYEAERLEADYQAELAEWCIAADEIRYYQPLVDEAAAEQSAWAAAERRAARGRLTAQHPTRRRARSRERRGRSTRRTRGGASSDDGPAEPPPPLGGQAEVHARAVRADDRPLRRRRESLGAVGA